MAGLKACPSERQRLMWTSWRDRCSQRDFSDCCMTKTKILRLGFPALERAGGSPPLLRMTALTNEGEVRGQRLFYNPCFHFGWEFAHATDGFRSRAQGHLRAAQDPHG